MVAGGIKFKPQGVIAAESMAVVAALKMAFRESPIRLKETMPAMEIIAITRPYSIAVAPRASLRSFLRVFNIAVPLPELIPSFGNFHQQPGADACP